MKNPIRIKDNAIIIELPDLKGKALYEGWAEGVAQETLEESSGLDEYLLAYKANVVLSAFVKALQPAVEESISRYAGDTYKGVKIAKGPESRDNFSFANIGEWTDVKEFLKELEDNLKAVYKARHGGKQAVRVVVNPFSGESISFTEDDCPENNPIKLFPFKLTI